MANRINQHRITLYVSEADYGVWNRAKVEADSAGMSLSAYVAYILGKKRLVVEDRE